MLRKNYKLNDVDYHVIMTALAEFARYHFDKSKTLKTEELAQYHGELFQKAINAQFELKEQKKEQD